MAVRCQIGDRRKDAQMGLSPLMESPSGSLNRSILTLCETICESSRVKVTKPEAGNVGFPSTFSGSGGSAALHAAYFELPVLVANRDCAYDV